MERQDAKTPRKTPGNFLFFISWRLGVLAFMISSASAADLFLPLDGYYRTGRYMPVRFGAAATELRLSADGAITTVIPTPAGGIAPFLAVASPLRNISFSQSLRELQSNEKLIGYAIDAPGVAEKIFADARIVPVRLDPTDPLPGFAAWWQTLDGVVLSGKQFQELSDWRTLLAGGTTIIVSDSKAPDTDWPWRSEMGYWVLRAYAPPPAIASDQNCQPIVGWMPGRPGVFRRAVVEVGAILAILIAAISLLRTRWAVVLGVIYGGLAVAAALSINHFQPEVAEAFGRIDTAGSYRTFNSWRFSRATKDREFSEGYFGEGLELPMLPSHGGPEQLILACNRRGTPIDFRYRLARNRAAAFLVVFANAEETGYPPSTIITSPLRLLLPSAYPGMTALGEYPAGISENSVFLNTTQWPWLLLANSDAIPKNVSGPSVRDSSNR